MNDKATALNRLQTRHDQDEEESEPVSESPAGVLPWPAE